MATTSTIPAFKSALVTALQTAVTSSVPVDYGHPGDMIEKTAIWVGRVSFNYEIPTMKAGRKARDESYSFPVFIDVLGLGERIEEVELAAFGYMAELEDILADNPGGIASVNYAYLGDGTSISEIYPDGAYCRIEVNVKVDTRLR